MAEIIDSNSPVLSFPAILRNPGLTNRFAHLHEGGLTHHNAVPVKPAAKRRIRENNEGKRWVRRSDNARFTHNPHIAPATARDRVPMPGGPLPTFPTPLPAYLPRTARLPNSGAAPVLLASSPNAGVLREVSANAGRFSLSLRGMRRELRRAGGRARGLVRDVETELEAWLDGGVVLNPDVSDSVAAGDADPLGKEVGQTQTIREVSRTPLQLVWRIPDDAFARYVVHCCARFHEVVSFSRGTSSTRLTYLLRPNVTRPDRSAVNSLATPPATDIDYTTGYSSANDGSGFSGYSSNDIDSDFVSDHEMMDSDREMSTIDEIPPPHPDSEDEAWSVIEEAVDGGVDAGANTQSRSVDTALAPRLAAMAISNVPSLPENEGTDAKADPDADRTLRAEDVPDLSDLPPAVSNNTSSPRHTVLPLNAQVTSRADSVSPSPRYRRRALPASALIRSASSPSRSPARMRRRIRTAKVKGARVMYTENDEDAANIGEVNGKGAFYRYLFE